MQQGYRQNLKGIGQLVMKLTTAEDYQKIKAQKSMFPFMVVSGHLITTPVYVAHQRFCSELSETYSL